MRSVVWPSTLLPPRLTAGLLGATVLILVVLLATSVVSLAFAIGALCGAVVAFVAAAVGARSRLRRLSPGAALDVDVAQLDRLEPLPHRPRRGTP